jgi:nitric oxide reductase subunit B
MQGLNTTPVHGHTALFGVYGMLGLGLTLFCLRALRPHAPHGDKALAVSFWAIGVGLLAMVLLSVLPLGLVQTWASVTHGYWYARSPELLQGSGLQTLRWMRVPGDTVFAIGAFVFAGYVLRIASQRGGAAIAPASAPPEAQAPAE